MENLDVILDIIKIVFAVVGVIVAAITTKYGVKNKRLKKFAENFTIVRNYTEKFIRLAEELQGFQGHMKKEWVLNKVHGICLQKGIPFDVDTVDKAVEEIVDLTKLVNKRPINQTKIPDQVSDIYTK